MFLGKQRKNLQGGRRLVIGSRCACDNFCFFLRKNKCNTHWWKGKKLVQQAKLQRSRFPALRQANFFASAFHRALDSKQQLAFNEPLFAALRKTKFSVAARELWFIFEYCPIRQWYASKNTVENFSYMQKITYIHIGSVFCTLKANVYLNRG